MKIVFRTNAGEEGLGHLNRIYSLYIALNKILGISLEPIFIVNNGACNRLLELGISKEIIYDSQCYDEKDSMLYTEIAPDIIIIDTYKATSEYIKWVKDKLDAIVALIDDNNSLYRDVCVDILINGNIYADTLGYEEMIKYQMKLTGIQYLTMNPIYWDKNLNKNYVSPRSLLLTCGASDSVGVMPKLIEWTQNLDFKKTIIIGPYFYENSVNLINEKIDGTYETIFQPINLKSYIEDSHIVLTASGSTVYEVLSLGKIPIVFIVGEDQILIASELEKYGVINLGWYYNMTEKAIQDAIKNASDPEYYNTLTKLFKSFDGNGAMRIARRIVDNVNERGR